MMLHRSSGKYGFRLFRERSVIEIDQETLKKILVYEDELRFSEKYQDLYTQDDALEYHQRITTELQVEALAKFGYSREALSTLQGARDRYKYDSEMNTLTCYMRTDHCTRGHMFAGMPLPDVHLETINGDGITLHRYMQQSGCGVNDRPLVLMGGSLS